MNRFFDDLRKPIILFGIIIALLAVLLCVSLFKKEEKQTVSTRVQEPETASEETAPVSQEVLEEEMEFINSSDGIVLSYHQEMSRDYLQNCIFLGDSRIVGMALYGYIATNTALAQIGLNHNNAMSTTYATSDGTIYTFDSYLLSHQAKVIYICYGVNGLNQKKEQFEADYQRLVERVKQLCPESSIVIQSIWPVRDDGIYSSVSNEKIDYYNEFLYDLAAEEDCYFLDIQAALKDDSGQMQPAYDGGDGLHYNRNAYEDIIAYIVSHPVPGVVPEPNNYKKETFVWKNTTGNGAPDSSTMAAEEWSEENSVSQNAVQEQENAGEELREGLSSNSLSDSSLAGTELPLEEEQMQSDGQPDNSITAEQPGNQENAEQPGNQENAEQQGDNAAGEQPEDAAAAEQPQLENGASKEEAAEGNDAAVENTNAGAEDAFLDEEPQELPEAVFETED